MNSVKCFGFIVCVVLCSGEMNEPRGTQGKIWLMNVVFLLPFEPNVIRSLFWIHTPVVVVKWEMCYIWQKYIHSKIFAYVRMHSRISLKQFQWTVGMFFFSLLFPSHSHKNFRNQTKRNALKYIHFIFILSATWYWLPPNAWQYFQDAHNLVLIEWNRY